MKGNKNAQNGVIRGHPRSLAMLPFNRARMISYSSLLETMRLSCTVFEIWRVSCRNLPSSTYPTCIRRPVEGDPVRISKKWHQKTRVPGLSCGVVYVFLCLAILVEHGQSCDGHTRTDRQTDRQTDRDIPREQSSRGKNDLNGILASKYNDVFYSMQ